MKKLILMALLSLVVLVSIAMVACGNKEEKILNTENMLNAEKATQIKQDFRNTFLQDTPATTISDISLFYYGTFNDSVVVMVHVKDTFHLRAEKWDIFEIRYPCACHCILAWNNSTFYRLSEAQTQGLLTTVNLEKIAKIHSCQEDNIYRNNAAWI